MERVCGVEWGVGKGLGLLEISELGHVLKFTNTNPRVELGNLTSRQPVDVLEQSLFTETQSTHQ